MATIAPDKRVKIYSEASDKGEQGFSTPPVVALSGAESNKNILGTYGDVLVEYNLEPSAMPDGSLVLGDNDRNVYELKPGKSYTLDPETDVYDGFGDGVNWVNITLRETINDAIDNKISFLWNTAVAASLVHPVSMFGSDGQLYNSVSGGNLQDNPVNGNTANWLLFLDPSAGLIFSGFETTISVSTVPNGYLAQDGSYVSKALYPNLYTFLQDGTGVCIYGETTDNFRLPDMRGYAARGWDNGAGTDPDANAVNITATGTGASLLTVPVNTTTGLSLGMVIEGTGVTPGTKITYIDYPASEITIDNSITTPSGGFTLTCHSRHYFNTDLGPSGTWIYDDDIRTTQDGTYGKHGHGDGNHTHNYVKLYATGDIGPSGGTTTRGNAPTGGATGFIDETGSTETRMINRYKQWIIKT